PIRRKRVEDLVPWKPELPHNLHLLHVDQCEGAVFSERWPCSRFAEEQRSAVAHQAVSSPVERNDGYPPRPFECHEPEHTAVLTPDDFYCCRLHRRGGDVTYIVLHYSCR